MGTSFCGIIHILEDLLEEVERIGSLKVMIYTYDTNTKGRYRTWEYGALAVDTRMFRENKLVLAGD